MTEYAYTKVSGKLKDFLGKVRSLGVPTNVSIKWLESIGYTSSNDRSILSVIRQIYFLDDANRPTEKWSRYRGGDYKKVLAEGIREGYLELFAIYPDAYNRTDEDLENYFRTKTTEEKQVISAIVRTFKALCELADFSSEAKLVSSSEGNVSVPPAPIRTPVEQPGNKEYPNFTPKLHIDIQIHISPDATSDQIEQIFASMATHIYRIKE